MMKQNKDKNKLIGRNLKENLKYKELFERELFLLFGDEEEKKDNKTGMGKTSNTKRLQKLFFFCSVFTPQNICTLKWNLKMDGSEYTADQLCPHTGVKI